MEWVKLGLPFHPHNTWPGHLSLKYASKNPEAFCGHPTQTQDGVIDENTALPQSLSTLTSLCDIPQAWLGSGTWGIPSLLLVSLPVSLVIITTLVRCFCPQSQCHPPPLSLSPHFPPVPSDP